MRARAVTAAALCGALLSAGCATAVVPAGTPIGITRQATFVQRAAVLEQRWNTDVHEGLTPSSLTPLRQELGHSPFETSAASAPLWLTKDGLSFLSSLDGRTAQIWDEAIAQARQAAGAVITAWTAMAAQYGAEVPATDATAAAAWPAQLASASTPAALNGLAAAWSNMLATSRGVAVAANALSASLAPYGGVNGLISAGLDADSTARADHLNEGEVPALLASLQAEVASHADITPGVDALLAPLQALRGDVGQDAHESAQLGSLQQLIGRANSMHIVHAAGFPAQYSGVAVAFASVTDGAALTNVEGRITALFNEVNSDINAVAAAASAAATAALAAQMHAAGCGHAVPMGKVVVVSIGQQEASFFSNTCLLSTTLVTTGRPGLRTPTGTFHVFGRSSPAHFVSGYAPGSPRYYTPETTRYALEYEGGGYYLHDAPWEDPSGFGPGSENGPSASHGCIHVPTAVMAWLYGWAATGTTVIVTG